MLAIVGFGAAAAQLKLEREEDANRTESLGRRFERGLIAALPQVIIHGRDVNRLAGVSSVTFRGLEGEALLIGLDMLGVCVSSGSACASGSLEPSHVLHAMGVSKAAAHGSLRFSWGRSNTHEELDFVLARLPEVVRRLIELAPPLDLESALR